MPRRVHLSCLIFACAALALAQTNPGPRKYFEQAQIEVHGPNLYAEANDPRPLQQMFDGLALRFEWNLNYEDPQYDYPEDFVDSTAPSWLAEHPEGRHVFFPAGGSFSVSLNGFDRTDPKNESRTLDAIVEAYNQGGNPGRFELRTLDDGTFTAVGVAAAHSSQIPILDTKITMNTASISAEDAFEQWTHELSVSVGSEVGYIGTGFAENYLFQKQVTILAENLPARDVLRQIIKATDANLHWYIWFDHDMNQYLFGLKAGLPNYSQIPDLSQLDSVGNTILAFSPNVDDQRYLSQLEAVPVQQRDDRPSEWIGFVPVLEDPVGQFYKLPPFGIVTVTPRGAAKARARFHVQPGDFHVVVLAKGGGVLAESTTPLSASQLKSLIAH
jgi:hypothetical protein